MLSRRSETIDFAGAHLCSSFTFAKNNEKKISIFLLLTCTLLHADTITEGSITQRDILDVLGIKAWTWEIKDPQGFDSVSVDVEVYKRNKSGEWEAPISSGHDRSYTDKKKTERIVFTIQNDTLFLKVGDGHGELNIDLADYDLERPVFHNVGSTGTKIEGGFIVASQFIERNRSTDALDDRDFYILIRITSDSEP
jgi:hypothetical protein